METITLKVSTELKERLRQASHRLHVWPSEIARMALGRFLAEMDEVQPTAPREKSEGVRNG